MSAEATEGEYVEAEDKTKSKPTAAIVRVDEPPPKKPSAISTARNLDELPLTEAAKVLMASGLVRNGEDIGKILTKLSLGRDLNLPAVSAINGIGIGPNSSIILSAALMRLLINRSGRYKLRVKQRDAKGSVIEAFERMSDGSWESCGVPVSFGPDDAKRAGLDTKDTYRKWPVDMYYARCLAATFRTYCPDCAAGAAAYLPEEIDGSGYRTNPDTMEMVPEAEVTPAAKSKPTATAATTKSEMIDRIKKMAAETGTDLRPFTQLYGKEDMGKLTLEELTDLERKARQKAANRPKGVAT
jgi:hypothetical protein